MTKRAKLIERFLTMPKDFTYDETVKLLRFFGYEEIANDGSKRAFVNKEDDNHMIFFHEPHPGNIMKRYVLELIKSKLEERGRL